MTQLVTYKDFWIIWRIPFSRQHILRLQTQYTPPRFPLRRKVGNVNFWSREEVEEWVRTMWRPTDQRSSTS